MSQGRKHFIDKSERERIVLLLNTRPLPEVKELTGRSWKTLLRIAEAIA